MAIDLLNTEADESWLHDLFDEAANDDWAGYGDTVQQKYAALFGKAFNPDEPRGGGPHHGEWTAGGSSGGTVSDMPGDSWGEKYDNWVAQQHATMQAVRERVAQRVNDALGKKEEPPPGPVKDVAPGEWKPSMTEAEADAWAVGPYAKQQFIHSTSPEGAKNIPVEGFRAGSDSRPDEIRAEKNNGYVMATQVKIKDILATGYTGLGQGTEHEVVVLNGYRPVWARRIE